MAFLGFVYGLLLGNCGYQTDRKIYDQSEIAVRLRSSRDKGAARDKFINSLRENNNAHQSLLSEVFFLLSLQANGKSFYP